MIFNELITNLQLYFLIFARVFALFMVAPVFYSTGIPAMARSGLALFTAVAVFPLVNTLAYVIPDDGIVYTFLLIAEVLTGVLIGLFLQIIFAIFLLAGQMFSVQMGFGASSSFDPLAQVEIPLVGQLFNLMGIFVFLASGSIQKVFITGIYQSFKAMKGDYLLTNPMFLSNSLISALAHLFEQSIIIAIPMIGTLLMISVTMGLLAKAAPQMNLMMVGFPIQISVGFLVIMMASPFLVEKMVLVIENGFNQIEELLYLYKMQGSSL
ncbi:MAG: flagellar biosynthetic protein FliR [Spirochaetaceae bacterium 4572_59]|nr:MAG: flagellar biosynthetic protein FliR [Spirochaetaceae bacterium 4572_59]